ncbi:MAG TPA: WhiB family transcriptional regulator [Jiangellaceae bacterium]|nr:WhiB family transcriptional regulator [Jiangellaceae bacterium]
MSLTVLPEARPGVARDALLPCQTADPELFFAESPHQLQTAKTLCQQCPIRTECLTEALQRAEPWGVWGGEVVVNGAVVEHKRARGRPPKQAAA